MDKIKKTSKQVRLITALTAVVTAIAIALALILTSLPSDILELDMTVNDIYSVTDTTRSLLNTLEHNIDIVVVSDTSSLDEHFTKFMKKYTALSDRLTLTYADPILQPSVTDTYGVESNTVLVSCPDTGRTATFSVSGFEGYDSAALLYDYSSYYMYGSLNLSAFDAEGQLSSAVARVISDNANTIYYLFGHGESTLGSYVSELLTKSNYDTEYLDLLSEGSIPDNCGLLICNTPTSDIAEAELTILKRYLANGGDMLLICEDPSLTNFNLLMQTYGIQLEQGYLADLTNYYETYVNQFGYYCFHPVLNSESAAVQGITSNAMILSARPLSLVSPERIGSSVEAFMSSSSNGVNYIDENNMTEGTYHVGVVATEYTDSGTTRFTVISSSYFVDDNLLSSFPSVSNKSIFMNAVNESFDDVTVLSVPTRSMTYERNTLTNTAMWGLFFAVLVPVLFIVFGVVFWAQRRKK